MKEYLNIAQKLIRMDEGRRQIPYNDATGITVRTDQGNLTVAYGHNLAIPMSEQLMLMILQYDLSVVDSELQEYSFFASLSDNRKAALADMYYNLGAREFGQFKRMLTAIRQGDWQEAAKQMQDSAWYEQVGSRAERLMYIILHNQIPEYYGLAQ